MHIDFENLLNDEYELFLPMPLFSADKVELELTKGDIYSDVIHVTNKGDGTFSAKVETIGMAIRIDAETISGNDATIIYHIDTNHFDPGDVKEVAILLTYLGGEKQIDFIIKLREATTKSVATTIIKSKEISLKKPKVKNSYKVQLSKKAYDLDEKARLFVMNHDIYPLTIKVKTADKDLILSDKFMTVNETGTIDISLKKGFLEFLLPKRKLMSMPVIHKALTLEIHNEEGVFDVEIPLIFTDYTAPVVEGKISSDRAYRKMILQIQSLYVKYLVSQKTPILKESLVFCEEAMAYHPTDIDLRLFYIILLIDSEETDEVYEQVTQLLKYSEFYEENGREEFTDIIKVLYKWLKGEDVGPHISDWPLTTYRQLFRCHLFEKKTLRFKDYEALYKGGVRSVFLYAQTVRFLNEHPIIPAKSSRYYAFLLRWAMNKQMVSKKWFDKIEHGYYQLLKYNLITSDLCFDLYRSVPSQGILKMLCTTLIDEAIYSSEAYAIYYEVLRAKMYIKDSLIHYVKAAYVNRLKIDISLFQMSTIQDKLEHDVLVYLFLEVVKNPMTFGSSLNLFKRQYEAFLPLCVHLAMTDDEMTLVGLELEDLIQRYQYKEIKGLLSVKSLNQLMNFDEAMVGRIVDIAAKELDYVWLESQLNIFLLVAFMKNDILSMYIEHLIKKASFDLLMSLHKKGYLSEIDDKMHMKIAVTLWDVNSEYSYMMAKSLYDKGLRDQQLLKILSEDYVASLGEMIDLYEVMLENQFVSISLMEKILYKGVLLRTLQERVYKVYKSYRNGDNKPLIIEVMNRFFAAQILIEDMTGTKGLMRIFEEDLYKSKYEQAIGLALLKLYQQLGEKNDVISKNLIKNSIKNGIIFPWFGDLVLPYIKESQFRKAVFFSYHSKSYVDVTLYYRGDGQKQYTKIKMKHVAFGMYIGYFIAFYQDHISYYYEEETIDGIKDITESGLYIHEKLVGPINDYNGFDTINTVIMSQLMEDDDSIKAAMAHYVDVRKKIRYQMVML